MSDGLSRVKSVFSSSGASPSKRKVYPSLWELPPVSDAEIEAVLAKTTTFGGSGRKKGKGKGKGKERILRAQDEDDEDYVDDDDYGDEEGYRMSGGLGEPH